jgi:benzoate membrane transport protein
MQEAALSDATVLPAQNNAPIQPDYRFWKNLRDIPSAITVSAVLSGLVVVILGYTSPLIIVIQAATAAKLSPAQTSSWVWAVIIGTGIGSIFQSLYFRMPLLGAFPTAGAALLVTSLANYRFEEAVGAYVLVGLAMIVLGLSGLFGRITQLVPTPVAMGMLAGVLFRFGTGLFASLADAPLLVIIMIATYYVLQRAGFRTPTIGALVAGVLTATIQGQVHLQNFTPALAVPIFTMPTFSVSATLGLAVPMFIVVLVSQYLPGYAVMRAAGFAPPIDKILVITGIGSTFFGFFGSHGLSMAAITAAITANPEAHPDPHKRYAASFANGLWYIAAGTFGATAIALFAGIPAALIAAISGLALTPTLVTSTSAAMADSKGREAGLAALLCAASNVNLLGIGSAFWALVVGLIIYTVLNQRREQPGLEHSGR